MGKGPVGIDPFIQAAAWGEYLESHARRVYSSGFAPGDMAARELAKHLLAKDLPMTFTLREAYLHHWAGLATAEECQPAADVLQALGWIVGERRATGGRPSVVYHINPAIYTLGAKG
jgi:hypothetical protein